MNILVTGASGYLGLKLTMSLANKGFNVTAYHKSNRNVDFLNHPNIQLVQGDVLDIDSLRSALMGIDLVYHVAGYNTDRWLDNLSIIADINIQGTMNVLSLCLDMGIKKLVYTGSSNILETMIEFDDEKIQEIQEDVFIENERTKLLAEQKVLECINRGLNAVIVNPSWIYGPGVGFPKNSITGIIHSISLGKWRFVPNQKKHKVNFVFIDDIIQGHILAMEKGTPGEVYSLYGEDADSDHLLTLIKRYARKPYKLVKTPVWLTKIIVRISNMLGMDTVFSSSFLSKTSQNWPTYEEKTNRDLDYTPITMEKGIQLTMDWFKDTYTLN